MPAVLTGLLLASAVGVGATSGAVPFVQLRAMLLGSGCDIKGNINDRGERIYHVPGQEYYHATRISLSRGERWFCSEAQARRAGWRKSRV